MPLNVPNDSTNGEILIPSNSQYVIGVDNIVTVINPAGTNPNVTYTAGTNTLTFYLAANSFGANEADIVTLSENMASVITTAANIADVNTTAFDIASIVITATDSAAINTVAGDTIVVNTTATNIASINTVANVVGNVNAVASSITSVNTVATNVADVNTAATNIASIVAAPTEASNAATSASASSDSAIAASNSENASQLSAWEAEAEKLTADSYATEAEDVFVNIWTSDGDGTFTSTPTTEYSALHYSTKSQLGTSSTSARNSVISAPTGVHALATTPQPSHIDVIYTGNGTAQNIVTGLPSVSRPWVSGDSYTIGDYKIHDYVIYEAITTHSAVVITPDVDATNWLAIADGVSVDADNMSLNNKSRSAIGNGYMISTLQPLGVSIATDVTSAEFALADSITSYNVDGFTVGANSFVNTNLATYVAWCDYFDKMFSFTTNHGKRGICAYNAQSGKFMTIYVGSGTAGHEIPHGVGTKPDFTQIKNRIDTASWLGYNSPSGATKGYSFDTSGAGVVSTTYWNDTEPTSSVITLGTSNNINGLNDNIIAYGSSNRTNHSYVGSYVGTGIAGKEVDAGMDLLALDTAGKNIKVMIKGLTAAASWYVTDNSRGEDNFLIADTSVAEAALDLYDFTNNGIVLKSATNNTANIQYLIEVTVEDFDNPNGGLDINQGTVLSFAEGTNSTTGDLDSIEATGATLAVPLIAGARNYFYVDKGDTKGSTIYPLIEAYPYITHDANSDTYDVVEGVVYDTTGTPIQRVYTGEAVVDISGEIIPDTLVEYAVKRTQVGDLVVHGGLDLGQKWTDETDSKVLNMNYTNGTDNTIFVHINATGNVNNGRINIYVDGELFESGGSSATYMLGMIVPVPKGSVYKVTGSVTLVIWKEYK